MADNTEADNGDRLYKCGHCGLTSPSITNLKLHMISSHLADTTSVEMVEMSDTTTATVVDSANPQQIEVAIPMDESHGEKIASYNFIY